MNLQRSTFLGALLAIGSLCAAAHAGELITVQNFSGSNTVFLSGGVLSGTDIPVTITFYAPNSHSATTATGELSFAATAVLGSGFYYAPFNTTYEAFTGITFSVVDDTAAHDLVLSGTADGGDLLGNGAGFTLTGQNVPYSGHPTGDAITYATSYFSLGDPSDFSYDFLFGPPSSGGSVTGTSVDDFTASLGPTTFLGSTVPEPASLGLLGVGAIGLLSRRRRRTA